MSDETDAKVLNEVQERFEVNITELPDEIDISSYSKYMLTCLDAVDLNAFILQYNIFFK